MYQDAAKTSLAIGTFVVKLLISLLAAIFITVLWIFAQIRVFWLSQNVSIEGLKLITGFDAYMAQNANCVINCPMGLTKMVDIDKVRLRLWQKVIEAKHENGQLRFWKFSHLIEKHNGLVYWRKVDYIDPKEHIFEYKGLQPATYKQLFEIISKFHSENLPSELPNWQFVFVPTTGQLKSAGIGCCMIVRMHHSICDGVSLVKLFARHIMDQDNKNKQITTNNNLRNFKSNEKISWAFIEDGIKNIVDGLSQIPSILWKQMLINSDNLIHGPHLKGCTRCYGITYDVSVIKYINMVTGATTNDIFLSCAAGALRAYFIAKNAPLPEELQAAVAINFQPKHDRTDLKNAFIVGDLQLPTGVSDAIERLHTTSDLMDKLKCSSHLFLVHIAMFYIIPYMPSFINRHFLDTTKHTSVTTSSLTLKDMDSTLFGGKLVNAFPVDVLLGKTGIGITCATLPAAGKVFVTFCADMAVIDNDQDFNLLVANFDSEIQKLKEFSGHKEKLHQSDI